MPSLTTDVSHSLDVPAAAERVKGLISRLKTKHAGRIDDVDEWWHGKGGEFSFTLSGLRIKGRTDVTPGSVRVKVELPLMAMAFRGTIEQTIRSEVEACLR